MLRALKKIRLRHPKLSSIDSISPPKEHPPGPEDDPTVQLGWKIQPRLDWGLHEYDRFVSGGLTLSAVESAISAVQEALDMIIIPPGHPLQWACLRAIALLRFARFQITHDATDINVSVEKINEALHLCVTHNLERLLVLDTAAYATFNRFDAFHNPSDLDTAIQHQKDVVEGHLPGDSEYVGSSDSMAYYVYCRYKLTRTLDDLNESVRYGQQAYDAVTKEDSRLWYIIKHLVQPLESRNGMTESQDDAKRLLALWREALDILPADDFRRSYTLRSLAVAIFASYRYNYDPKALDEATTYAEESIKALPPTPREHAESLHLIGQISLAKYNHFQDDADYNTAVRSLREASEHVSTEDHINLMMLEDLGNATFDHYVNRRSRAENRGDLETAISTFREWLDLVPSEYRRRPVALMGLGNALLERAKTPSRHPDDLSKALQHLEEALAHCPDDNPRKPFHLVDVARALLTKNKEARSIPDIKTAVSYQEVALALSPPETVCHIAVVLALAEGYSTLRSAEVGHDFRQGPTEDVLGPSSHFARKAAVTTVLSHLRNLATDEVVPISTKMDAAARWALLAAVHGHDSVLDAYALSLELLHMQVGLQDTLEEQRTEVAFMAPHWKALPMDAAAQAVLRGQVKRAVEFLEQGRSMLLSRLASYETSVEALAEVAPDLAARYAELSGLLKRAAISRADGSASAGAADGPRYREALTEWRKTVEMIHAMPGFTSFLRARGFDDLKKAASKGPVLIVNVSQWRCDGIIVLGDSDPLSVPLPELDMKIAEDLPESLFEALTDLEDINGRPGARSGAIGRVLERAWTIIAGPILTELEQRLGMPTPEQKRRIWWCPTHWLWQLPLHAAGIYKPKQRKVPDLYISSYTPSLHSLAEALSPPKRPLQDASRLLLVGQPSATGYQPLVSVEEEINRVQGMVPSNTVLVGDHAKSDVVLNAIGEHPWIHLACHGEQNTKEPFRSRYLVNGEIHLSDLIQKGLPGAEFAYLSACNSMGGDVYASNEILHLAAGMQFAGFRSVIGSLWESFDTDAPTMAEAFYKYLLRNGVENATYTDSAEALSEAIKVLRKNKVPYERWINFVHYGA